VDKSLTKKEIGNLIDQVYRHCGQKATVIFADQIMRLGFREAAKAGISFGKDDIIVPTRKQGIIDTTRKLVEEYEQQYADGLSPRARSITRWSTPGPRRPTESQTR
jgi:DNA-directed RNA polymerase subunit beta'